MFDDIRPYYDSEIPQAMKTIANWEYFSQAVRFIYPDMDVEEARRRMLEIDTVHKFQSTFMNDAIRRIIGETTDGFTYSGLHHLRRGEAYLFVSNHRDITLDAFLLQHVLLEQRGCTSHIVFGQNLLEMPEIEVLFRSNKLIRMERGGSPRAFYQSLHHLSEYLTQLVVEQRQSVWIAQRNGRAKDGHDITAPAIIKMLAMGGNGTPQQNLERLHLVPLSISYEWDPCDAMKAAELLQSQQGTYHKAVGEDTRSVVTGIIGRKGHVHLTIGKPLRASDLNAEPGEDMAEHVARVLDKRIQHGYRLMPTNHVAYSLLNEHSPSKKYRQATREQFLSRLRALPSDEARHLVTEAYAAPVLAQKPSHKLR